MIPQLPISVNAGSAGGDTRSGGDAAVLGYTSISDRWLIHAVSESDKAIEQAAKISAAMSYKERANRDAEWAKFQKDYEQRQNSRAAWEKRVLEEWAVAPAGLSEGERFSASISIYRKMAKCQVRYKTPNRGGVSPSGRRGSVASFSEKSRNRMQEKMAQIDDNRQAFFLTLTYPDQFPSDHRVFKNHLAMFRKRLMRLYEQAAGLWRLEIKERKSGKNRGWVAPHYHMIVWLPDGETTANFKEWATRAWLEVIGESGNKYARRHGVNCKRVQNLDHASYYVSKYASKAGDDGDGLAWGRRWATFGRIQWGQCFKRHLTPQEHAHLKTLIAGWLITRGESPSGYVETITGAGNMAGYRALGLGFDTIEDGRRTIYRYLVAAGEWDELTQTM